MPELHTSLVRMYVPLSSVGVSVFFLFSTVILYAVIGQPTPESYGWVEYMLAVLLIFAVSFNGVRHALIYDAKRPLWCIWGQILLLYGLFVPTIMFLHNGGGYHQYFRDVVSFLFLFLPLFFYKRIDVEHQFYVLIAVVFLGVVYSLRSLLGADKLYYLSNSPAVLFSAIFLCGVALKLFAERFSFRSLCVSIVFILFAAICVFAMFEGKQRAFIGCFVISELVILAFLMRAYPKRVMIILAIMFAVFYNITAEIVPFLDVLLEKHRISGLNSRLEEFQAVMSLISEDLTSLLFGKGWGAGFASPAVAEVHVYYTHSLFSYVLLKGGIVGCTLCLFYFFALIRHLLYISKGQIVLVLALIAPLLVSVLLYASYKSFDFGLVLLLVSLVIVRENIQNHMDQKIHGGEKPQMIEN